MSMQLCTHCCGTPLCQGCMQRWQRWWQQSKLEHVLVLAGVHARLAPQSHAAAASAQRPTLPASSLSAQPSFPLPAAPLLGQCHGSARSGAPSLPPPSTAATPGTGMSSSPPTCPLREFAAADVYSRTVAQQWWRRSSCSDARLRVAGECCADHATVHHLDASGRLARRPYSNKWWARRGTNGPTLSLHDCLQGMGRDGCHELGRDAGHSGRCSCCAPLGGAHAQPALPGCPHGCHPPRTGLRPSMHGLLRGRPAGCCRCSIHQRRHSD